MPRPYGLIIGEGMFKGQRGLGQDDGSDDLSNAATLLATPPVGPNAGMALTGSTSTLLESYNPSTMGTLTNYTPYLVLGGGALLAFWLLDSLHPDRRR